MTEQELSEALEHVKEHDVDWGECYLLESLPWLVQEVVRLRKAHRAIQEWSRRNDVHARAGGLGLAYPEAEASVALGEEPELGGEVLFG